MTDTVRRVRYRERQFLRAADLNDEQAYRIAMRRRHNIGHHEWGIVAGLELERVEDGDGLLVKPGMAVDGYGRELIIPEPVPLPMYVCDEPINIFDALQSEAIDVWLLYGRVPATPAQRGRWECGPDQHSRWREEARLRLTLADTLDPRQPVEVPEADLDFGPHEVPPDDPEREWPVYLGRIIRTWLFRVGDLKDPTSLAIKLREALDPLSDYLRGQLSPDTQQLLDKYADSSPPSEVLLKALVAELNQLLQGESLYDEQRFAQVALREETKRLIEQDPQGEDLIRLNRLLLEDGYPGEIARKHYDTVPSKRPYVTLIGEVITAPSDRAKMQVGSELAGDHRRFVVSVPDETDVWTDRLSIDRDGNTTVRGNTTLDGDLVLCSLLLCAGDLKNPTSLAIRLRDAGDPLSQYLKEQFSDATLKLLEEYDGSGDLSEELRQALVAELNQLLQGESLYEAERFAQVTLRDETQRLIEQQPQGEDLVYLNRLLLEDGYPEEIAKSQAQRLLAGGVEFGPMATPPEKAAPWQIYRTVVTENGTTINELRMEIGHPGDKGDPTRNRLVIGHWDQANNFVPCLTVRADCTVVVHGVLKPEEQVIKAPIQPDLDDPRFMETLVSSSHQGLVAAAMMTDPVYGVELSLSTQAPESIYDGNNTVSYTVKVYNIGLSAVTNISVIESLYVDDVLVAQRTIDSGFTLHPAQWKDIGTDFGIPEEAQEAGKRIVLTVSAHGVGPVYNPVRASTQTTVTVEELPA